MYTHIPFASKSTPKNQIHLSVPTGLFRQYFELLIIDHPMWLGFELASIRLSV